MVFVIVNCLGPYTTSFVVVTGASPIRKLT